MEKAKAHLICNVCETIVEECAECSHPIEPNITMLCAGEDWHYHEDCASI